ncbi:hypothetical protein CERSUDRAFT_113890 [Gelatoporia subvermispora B]|uniref:NADP-dependent oxidoreductase domain-containing protein n=1 Tax=Ceriporiopsis subvermispora (strain B) TaxID=914234 RepID=M2QJN1_CERS8|nr:hypothetical protein CERSUDRAFT_113890 [Gelatoporia subvermispora B]
MISSRISMGMRLASGHRIPALGLNISNRALTPRQTTSSIREALRAGYRLFNIDYPNRSDLLHFGRVVRASRLKRDELFISATFTTTTEKGCKRKLINKLLTWLGMDYFDLICVNEPESNLERLLTAYQSLTTSRDEGIVKNIGVVNCGLQELQAIRSAFDTPSVNRLEVHPRCQHRSLVAHCHSHSTHIQAHLPFDNTDWWDHPVIHEIASKYERSPKTVAMRWCLNHGYSLLTSLNLAHISRIWSRADALKLSLANEDMATLDAIYYEKLDMPTEEAIPAPETWHDWIHIAQNPDWERLPPAHWRRMDFIYDKDGSPISSRRAHRRRVRRKVPSRWAKYGAPSRMLGRLSTAIMRGAREGDNVPARGDSGGVKGETMSLNGSTHYPSSPR